MIRLPLRLRLFWLGYILFVAALVAPKIGPLVEGIVAPLRTDQHVVRIRRFPVVFRFEWTNLKLRNAPWIDIDVALVTKRDDKVVDRAVVTLYRDESEPGEAPCTRKNPWSSLGRVGPGPHKQPFCVEIPSTTRPTDSMTLSVRARYRGFLGLWELPVDIPDVEVDPVSPTS